LDIDVKIIAANQKGAEILGGPVDAENNHLLS
jgi:hypothetical protein